ncbi:hypothetical protein ACFLT4_03350 [Chloroflexota bacterium]
MRKGLLIVASLSLAFALLGNVGCAAITPGESNFNLIFKYGIMAKNELNTFQGTYIKDMIMDPSVMVNLSLSEEEKDRIYQKMIEIDFFSYPDEFSVSVPVGGSIGMVTPHASYYFKVEYDSKIKELRWEDKITNKDEKADSLRGLIKLIRDIIESKEEYKKLPPPRGGYL